MEEALAHIRKVDRKMARLIERVGPYALEQEARETFPALLRAIVFQQLNGKAAATIHARVLAAAAGPTPRRGHPKPEAFLAVLPEALRAAGLSRQKLSYVLDLCAKAAAGELPARRALQKLDDAAVIEALTVVKGVGRWSVEMLLMFNLGRLDVLPATDYGVRTGFARVYGKGPVEDRVLPTPRELLEFGERWRPYRTIPSWYLWRATEL